MTQEELESLPSPGDVSNAALGASAMATLEAAVQGTNVAPAPPLIEDGGFTPPVEGAPSTDDDSEGEEDSSNSVVGAAVSNAIPAAPIDMMARATQEVDRQTAQIR